MNPVMPKLKTTKPSTSNDLEAVTPKKHVSSKVVGAKDIDAKPKKGFSSLPKVPSTYNFNPKDLLLDNFFNAYRPMTLPISPPVTPQRKMPSGLPAALKNAGGTLIYFEIDDNMDFMDQLKNRDEMNVDETVEDIERRTSTRFDHSHKSLKEEDSKAEEYERDLFDSKLQLATEDDLSNTENNSNIVESKRYRGRRKLQYKKRSNDK